ncbi:N-acyl homoserine lactonase family protein [Nitrosomonas sp. Nm33]|uniref:N-acyl homoserine lactonase family protein n=1 Tax=Nitrosomonas sp. Nm33 TaxID=133724 RepID=UPI00089CFAB7|nr:N-acyl homoserine lactonase family protein [Nitrosomonas sp. Nm33]SDY27957.1 N-acyl homoserine lactone hydrolase [Nitrosomonas sp. Nm33]
MPHALKIWTLLTGNIRYEKIISTRNRGHGQWIEAPILAYLIETPNGRILYDAGCDYRKLANPALRTRYFTSIHSTVETPRMQADQRVPHYLERLGLTPADIDLVFISHLHFDHAGGLCDLPGCEVHIHQDELTAARTGLDSGVFADELANSDQWYLQTDEYEVAPGVEAITTPGHTAGHMSLFIHLPKGRPVILCGDAADLNENLTDEIAPGCCWQDNVEQALSSIRKLKSLALIENAQLWPNHDLAFFKTLPEFPQWHD